MTAVRQSPRCPRGDSGFTLAEMLVATAISALVMLVAGTLFSASLQSNQTSEARLNTINDGRLSVATMGRSLRTAVLPSQLDDASNTDTAFLQAESFTVSFYADIDNLNNSVGPSRVSYAVNASNQLVEISQRPLPNPVNHNFQYCDPALASCVTRTTVLAEGVDRTSPIFTYYDQSTAVLPYVTTCPDGNGCLSGLDLANVDAVDIKVVLRRPTSRPIGPTTYLLRVSLPNHDSIVRGASS